MVKITVESEGTTQTVEGESVIVYMCEPTNNDGNCAVMMIGRGVNPLQRIETAIVSIGSLIKHFVENPFGQAAAANMIAKALVESMEDERLAVVKKEIVQEKTVPEG